MSEETKQCDLPVRKAKCSTCPWLEGSPYAHLIETPLVERDHICHSTNKEFNPEAKSPALCRGHRDLTLAGLMENGMIDEATDAAWNKVRVRMGMEPQQLCS